MQRSSVLGVMPALRRLRPALSSSQRKASTAAQRLFTSTRTTRMTPSVNVRAAASLSGSADATQPAGTHSTIKSDTKLNGSGSSSQTSSQRAAGQQPKPVEYYNFATREEFLRRYGGGSRPRRSRARSQGIAEDEQIMRLNLLSRQSTDPHAFVPVFRREMVAYNGTRGPSNLSQIQISLDVPAKRFLDMFYDFESKRCKLCNEGILQWHLHSGGIPHAGREGILLELVRPFCGTPEEQVQRWTAQLVNDTSYGRIPALSHTNSQIRKRRLQYLLHYLKDRAVLVNVFNLMNNNGPLTDASRGFEFERLEFIGDGVVKYVLTNIIDIVFPVMQGGCRGRLSNFQFVMDGNEGLARGYDYLELQDLTRNSRVVSKFKSDVVETLFGELQFYLWETELDISAEPVTFPFTKDIFSLRAIARHVMYETATVLFLYHVEYILGMLQRVAREEQLQVVRADPSLLHMQQQRGGGDYAAARSRRGSFSFSADDDDGFGGADDDGYFGGGGAGGARGGGLSMVAAPTKTLMKVRVARSHLHGGGGAGGAAASYLEATNYDNFKRVVPIGGLLPRPFTRAQLSVIPNYMPHVQRDVALTEHVRRTEHVWAAQLSSELQEKPIVQLVPSASGAGKVGRDDYQLSSAPSVRTPEEVKRAQEHLTVPRLKDEELIAELI